MDRLKLRNVRTAEFLLLAFGATALVVHLSGVGAPPGYGFAGPSPEPLWLSVFAAISGAGFAFCGTGLHSQPDKSLRISAALAFVLLVVSGHELFLTVIGGAFIAAGGVGFTEGRIGVSGKTGPVRVYTGGAAYGFSALFVATGVLALLMATFGPR